MIFFFLLAGLAAGAAIQFASKPTWDGVLGVVLTIFLAYDQWKNRYNPFPWLVLSKMFVCMFSFPAALIGLIVLIAEHNILAGVAAITFATIFVYQWRHLND